MPSRRSRRGTSGAAATLLAVLLSGSISTTQPMPAVVETLCVLDFQRLGDDADTDWLEQGLADMMISVLQSDSPYLVIERRHLREILQEHGLAQSGLVDLDSAVRRARLTKAQLLLLGSFARQGDIVTVQVRLVRVADQRILAQVTWSDQYTKVLTAPQMLTQRLQAGSGRAVDSKAATASLEVRIPRTIDVAESFYKGVRSFDEGQYPEALAHYLDASRASDFRKAPAGVLEMYYLLGRSEHAVCCCP